MEFERAIQTSSQGERRAIETVQHNVNTLGGTAPNGGGTISSHDQVYNMRS